MKSYLRTRFKAGVIMHIGLALGEAMTSQNGCCAA